MKEQAFNLPPPSIPRYPACFRLHANRVQVNALEVLAHHAVTNLLHRLPLERHFVGIVSLLGAGRTLRPMETLKATVQAGMA